MSLPPRSWVMSTQVTSSALKPLLTVPVLQLLVPVLAMPLPLPQPLVAPTNPLCVGITDLMLRKIRLLSVLAWLTPIGLITCLWCSLVSGLFPKKTLGSPSLRLCSVLLLLFLESF